MKSYEQWEYIGECECGADIYQMGDKTKRPDCICYMDDLVLRINNNKIQPLNLQKFVEDILLP